MIRMGKAVPEFCFLLLLIGHVACELPSIRPVPCSNRMTGEFGVCTFNWSCINVAHGVHIGPCVDRFFVGTCCKIPPGTAAEQGQGPRKSESHSYSGSRAGNSDNGVGQGTRKVGEMPTYSQFHHTVAPKAQKEKLNGGKPIHLIDIGHFNVSLSPAVYYDFQYNGTSPPPHELSSKLNNAAHFEQNPPVDFSSSLSSTHKIIPSASFFYTILFSNYSKPGSSKESPNKTVDSVLTSFGNNDSSIHSHTKTDISRTKTTSSYSGTASAVLSESSSTLRRPVAQHPSHDQRKPLKPHEEHNLRKPVGYDPSHNLRKPVPLYNIHDERKPLKPHDQHDLRKPVGLDEAHDQRWPVLDEDTHDQRMPGLDDDHDQRWPVLEEDTHDQRLPGLDDDHDQRWPVLDEDTHDQRLPVTNEHQDQRLPSTSDDNLLPIEHLFKWIGKPYTNANQLSSNSEFSKVIPTSTVPTNIMITTELTPSPSYATPYYSKESTILNFGQEDVTSTKATPTTFSFQESTNFLSNFTLFVRPTSSRPSYKPFQQLPEPKPTGAKIFLNDTSKVCGRSRSGTTARIVGGIKSHYLRWPWMISLRRLDGKSYKHKCGATLLNQYWAITAAHCIDGKLATDIILRLGEYNFRRADEMHPHVDRRISVVMIHPDFDRVTYENDLALLRFQEPVQLRANIVPICLPRNLDDITGRIAVVTGWGRLAEDGELPTSLHEVHLPIVGNKECEDMYYEAGFAERIRDVFVCAGVSDGGLDACEGDSGGPMVIRGDHGEWVLVGLISWGMGCAAPKQPGVYTRISYFIEWIDGIIAH